MNSIRAALQREYQPGSAPWNIDALAWLVPEEPLSSAIHVVGAPNSFVAEQFRLLQTRLQEIRERRPLKTVLLTSSLSEEGRSFIALNLAVALAQRGRNKVLLLEADLRHPSYCGTLGVGDVPGLVDCCSCDSPVAHFLYRISGVDFCVLPAGRPALHALEALNWQRIQTLLEEVGKVFDWVVLDSAPLLPFADSATLWRLCDGIVLVVRRHTASKKALAEALGRVEPAKLIGVVLNDFPVPFAGGCERYDKARAAQRSHAHFPRPDRPTNTA